MGTDHSAAKKRERILTKLDHMLAAGRVTETEASRLRAASDPGEFDNVIRDISLRHAGAKLNAAVENGDMTQDEANVHLESLKHGEHPRSLRTYLRRLLARSH